MGKTEFIPENYIQKLLELARQFDDYYNKKEWGKAKYTYDTVLRIVEVFGAPEEIKTQLFGNYMDEENIVEGMFCKWQVDKVYTECVIRLYESYENESYRRYGQPPQYYPQPRYPVPGYSR